MIEPAMFFGIGFLFASLLGIVLVPLVHSRAVRLTMRRLEAATPLSMAEIQADKDQLRAEFAMSTRRLEISVEQMKAKTTNQLAELGKKSDAINRLKVELGEKTTTIFALEAREKALKDQLRATEEEYGVRTSSLRESERTLLNKEAELAKLMSELAERSSLADSQRVEGASLRTQIEALKIRIAQYDAELKHTEDRMERERVEAAEATNELTDERGKVENLGRRIAQLEDQLMTQTAQTESLGRRVQELEGHLIEKARLLGEREYECDQLRAEVEHVRQTVAELRTDIASADDHYGTSSSQLRSEKSALQTELERTQAERAKLQREITAMNREAESAWAAERVENALLRERINDIAAEVARLTVVLEGPDSPIEAILAAESMPALKSVNGPAKGEGIRRSKQPADSDARGNLAERMRALQNRASRVPTNS
jgi:chromosome segregation ATPase